jgi:hypothetical protein
VNLEAAVWQSPSGEYRHELIVRHTLIVERTIRETWIVQRVRLEIFLEQSLKNLREITARNS